MTIATNLGPITAKIDRSRCPAPPASFTHLADKGFFDNTKCHRLVTEGINVLQCGDPSAHRLGLAGHRRHRRPSYGMPRRTCPPTSMPPYPDGDIAMANSGQPGSTGSQFFIVYDD